MKEPAEHHHFWVQAPVPPLDVDGLAVVTVGTVIFALTSVVLAIGYDWLAAHGHGSWLQISVAGFALGLIGLAYCWNRRRRRRSEVICAPNRTRTNDLKAEALLVQLMARETAEHQRVTHPGGQPR